MQKPWISASVGKGSAATLSNTSLPSADERLRLLGIRERGELVDVGAGGEAVLLGRDDREPLGRHRHEMVGDAAQLAQHFARERIGAGVGAIEGQPCEVVGVGREFPVLEDHLFFLAGFPPARE